MANFDQVGKTDGLEPFPRKFPFPALEQPLLSQSATKQKKFSSILNLSTIGMSLKQKGIQNYPQLTFNCFILEIAITRPITQSKIMKLKI